MRATPRQNSLVAEASIETIPEKVAGKPRVLGAFLLLHRFHLLVVFYDTRGHEKVVVHCILTS